MKFIAFVLAFALVGCAAAPPVTSDSRAGRVAPGFAAPLNLRGTELVGDPDLVFFDTRVFRAMREIQGKEYGLASDARASGPLSRWRPPLRRYP